MPRSEEAEAFHTTVCLAVQEIPRGKVTSYGHIAALIGTPQRPRQVGVCMKHLSDSADSRFNIDNVPWQRVINSKGVISPRSKVGGRQAQKDALEAEGVEVTNNLGELNVDFAVYGWFPRTLPSESDPANDGEASDAEAATHS